MLAVLILYWQALPACPEIAWVALQGLVMLGIHGSFVVLKVFVTPEGVSTGVYFPVVYLVTTSVFAYGYHRWHDPIRHGQMIAHLSMGCSGACKMDWGVGTFVLFGIPAAAAAAANGTCVALRPFSTTQQYLLLSFWAFVHVFMQAHLFLCETTVLTSATCLPTLVVGYVQTRCARIPQNAAHQPSQLTVALASANTSGAAGELATGCAAIASLDASSEPISMTDVEAAPAVGNGGKNPGLLLRCVHCRQLVQLRQSTLGQPFLIQCTLCGQKMARHANAPGPNRKRRKAN